MQEKKIFLMIFIIVSFVTKIIAEFVHEVCGHGFFVLLFGGTIKTVHISVLWPYELSYISWSLPSHVTPIQKAWIYSGGILVCLCVSFLIQAFLLLRKGTSQHLSITLFWFAFWNFISSIGYLLIGGLTPLGDVYELIRLKVLTSTISLAIGLIFFIIGFVTLSWILRKILSKIFSFKEASLGVTLFWLIIPMLIMLILISPERNLQVAYFPLAFIPTLFSFIIEYFFISSKQKANKNPDNVAKK